MVRVDIPELGVEGACLSILGAAREQLGLVLFPSRLAFDAFLARAEEGLDEDAPDLGTELLALSFERAAALAPELRRELGLPG